MTDRVLVTGASGFIGHHLVRLLQEGGHQVTCLVRRTSAISDLEKAGVAFAYGDVTEPGSVEAPIRKADIVYHLAALTTALGPLEFEAVNVGGVKNVAQACASIPSPPSLVVLSSLAAAGPSPADRPTVETDPPRPVSNYGRSKLAGERAARALSDQVPTTIVRAPWVFGERDRDTYKIFRMMRYGLLLVPVTSTNRYSIIHAADLATGLILAAGKGERATPDGEDAGAGLYYIAGDAQPTYRQIGLAIGHALGKENPIVLNVPKLVAVGVAAVLEAGAQLLRVTPDIVNLDKAREGYAGSWACSPVKAREQLGFVAGGSFPGRLSQTAEWYTSKGWL